MKCCTLPGDGSKGRSKGLAKMTVGSGTGSKLAKAAHKCKGKKGIAFKKCVILKIKKL